MELHIMILFYITDYIKIMRCEIIFYNLLLQFYVNYTDFELWNSRSCQT